MSGHRESAAQVVKDETNNVPLTPELEQLIHRKVEGGLYVSASEVVREALRLLDERDSVNATRLEELRREIQIGIDQADRGELLDGTEVFAKLRTKVRAPRAGMAAASEKTPDYSRG